MKILLLLIIKLYWRCIPASKRRKCLFKTSCSNHVFDKAKSEGLISGLRALQFRIKNCNANYNIIHVNGEKILISATQKTFKENELSSSIVN